MTRRVISSLHLNLFILDNVLDHNWFECAALTFICEKDPVLLVFMVNFTVVILPEHCKWSLIGAWGHF